MIIKIFILVLYISVYIFLYLKGKRSKNYKKTMVFYLVAALLSPFICTAIAAIPILFYRVNTQNVVPAIFRYYFIAFIISTTLVFIVNAFILIGRLIIDKITQNKNIHYIEPVEEKKSTLNYIYICIFSLGSLLILSYLWLIQIPS